MESLAATNETRILSDMKTDAHYQLFADLLRTPPETGDAPSQATRCPPHPMQLSER